MANPGNTPKRKRNRIEDSVYFDNTKKRWVARIPVGVYADGSPKRVRRFFRTRVEAERGLSQLHLEHKTGRLQPSDSTTLGEWLDLWLSVHRSKGARATDEFYRGIVDLHIKPSLGHRRLAQVQPGEIEALYRKLEQQGLRRVPYATHQTLRASLNRAKQLGYLNVNPMERVLPPKQPSRRESFMRQEEAMRFLKACEHAPDELRALALVGLETGLRLGELTGIRWSDVDFEHKLIAVGVQLKTRGGVSHEDLKTVKSVRTVAISDETVEALRAERARQVVNGFENPMGLALLNSEGRHWHQKNVNAKLKQLCVQAKVEPLSAHKLFRHSCATLMAKNGVSLHDISRQLGHSSINLTANLYAHHEVEASRRAIEKVRQALRP